MTSVKKVSIPDDMGIEIFSVPFPPIDSRMYMMIAQNEALIVDPCVNTDAFNFLLDRNVKKICILITHGHYDHISGVNQMRRLFDCTVIANESTASMLSLPSKNLSKYYESLFCFFSEDVRAYIRQLNIQPYVCTADVTFNGVYDFTFYEKAVHIQPTPGHTKDSVCIILNGKIIFTGDSLIPNNPVATRLPTGSRKEWLNITWRYLQSLPRDLLVLPGHGETINLGELRDEARSYISNI